MNPPSLERIITAIAGKHDIAAGDAVAALRLALDIAAQLSRLTDCGAFHDADDQDKAIALSCIADVYDDTGDANVYAAKIVIAQIAFGMAGQDNDDTFIKAVVVAAVENDVCEELHDIVADLYGPINALC